MSPEEKALRDIRSFLLELKDAVVLRLVNRESISDTDVFVLRKFIGDLKASDVGDRMEETLSDWMRWSYEQGIKSIDASLEGDLLEALRTPQGSTVSDEMIELTRAYDASRIKSIPKEALDRVAQKLSLTFIGQRTPGEIADQLAKEFDVSLSRAETIVRTEIGTQQNLGAEARIQQVASSAKELNIPVVRVWIHSTAQTDEGAKKGRSRAGYTPRPHHKALHGQTVAPDEKFRLVSPDGGIYMVDGPHDPILPAGEVVNCYCRRAIKIDRETLDVRESVAPHVVTITTYHESMFEGDL